MMPIVQKAAALSDVLRITWWLALVQFVSSSGVPCGDFTCKNGAKCAKGPPSFDDHKLVDGSFLSFHQNGMEDSSEHCECPPRYTGIDCSVPYQECGGGGHKCYFGGQCFLGLEDVLGADDLFCDCSLAFDIYGLQYSGKYCENLLTDTDEGIPLWSRPESTEEDAEALAACGLSCQNGGTCKTGKPDPKDKMAYDVYRRSDSAQVFEWCDCPSGYFGDLCEMPSVPCGDKVCFNDGACVEKKNSTGHTNHECSCQGPYDGKYCEFKATSKCPIDNKNGNSEERDYWCMNGAHCRYEAYLGCLCPPGYHGLSCSYFDLSESGNQNLGVGCDLDCNGHGTCARDEKDTSYLDVANGAESSKASSSKKLERCVCEEGFSGSHCEVEAMKHYEEEASRELVSAARIIFLLALIMLTTAVLAITVYKSDVLNWYNKKGTTNSILYHSVKSNRPLTVMPPSMAQWPTDCPNPDDLNLSPSALLDEDYTEAFKPSPSTTPVGDVPRPPDDDVEADGEVVLFMGPEMDEDGNELSNVNII